MKKYILSVIMLTGLCLTAKADSITDQLQVALFQHVETVVETRTNGTTVTELLATPIEIGKMDSQYLIGIDGGVLGGQIPQPNDPSVAWTAGIHAHLTPLIKKYILPNISPNYPALSSIELNPRVGIQFINGHKIGTFGFGIGWAFSVTPLQ